MIKCNKCCSEISGYIDGLLSEYTVITMNLRKSLTEEKSEEFAKHVLERAFALGMMSEEELDKEMEESRRRFARTGLGAILEELFGGVLDDPD